jgi:hypothetical protein
MNQETVSKWVLKSKTVWGVTMTVVFGFLPALSLATGVDVKPTDLLPFSESVTLAIDAIGSGIGAALVLYSRLTAPTAPVTVLPPAPPAE